MPLTQFTDNVAIVAALADLPNDTGGLTATQLKAKFDTAATLIKTYLNSTLLAELAAVIDGDSGADNIGATAITGLAGTTVQSLLESLKTLTDGLTAGTGLANSSVTTAKIALLAVTAAQIANATITATQLADGAVTSAKILDGTISTTDLADAIITTAKLALLSVTTAQLADNSVTSAKIADGTIATADIADGAITSLKIADGAIINADINVSAAIDASKIGAGTVSNTEFGYLDGVTQSIQTQINGIVLGSIPDGSLTPAKLSFDPATQAELDAGLATKAPINNAVFTGTTTLAADPVSALQAATKQYSDNTEANSEILMWMGM